MPVKGRKGIAVYAFAKKMGVTDNAVRSRIRNGRMAGAVHDDGSLDEEIATALWKREPPVKKLKFEPRAAPSSAIADQAKDGGSEFEIKLARMRISLEKERLELEKLKENTVDRDEARRAVRAFGRGIRDLMLNFANRYGAGIAAELKCDPATLIGLVDARMREMLLEGMAVPAPYIKPKEPPPLGDQAE